MFQTEIEMQDKYIKIIIHAGYHKTASTHLQNKLLKNENLFVKSGCSYLEPERIHDEFDTLRRALGRSDPPDQQKANLRPWRLVNHDFSS
jgi:hypothetical protein